VPGSRHGSPDDRVETDIKDKFMRVHAYLKPTVLISVLLMSQPGAAADASRPRLMTPQELTAVPARAADKRVTYGADLNQFGELRIPTGRGPHPIVVLIHGGCFKAAYASLRDLAPMGDALKAQGIATWNVEYRRLGQPGGGWPGTHQDIGRAVDQLRALAETYRLDLNRVVIVGHSAGGHLAMWAASRSQIPPESALYANDPLKVRGVVDLAGPVDLSANIDGYEGLCQDTVITSLLGGTPATVPERYAQASPRRLLPLGVPQVLILGQYEEYVPLALAQEYIAAARRAGDTVQLQVIPGVGHFEIASPRASTWPRVRSSIRALLDGQN
jgi:acetyl esterase/lipase